jgi:hypothetical protein
LVVIAHLPRVNPHAAFHRHFQPLLIVEYSV